MLRRLHDDRGATAVIVVIALVAIFAMLMLTVDVGGLLYKRRELVNGSDAAALAAAQTCANPTDPSKPETMADTYATANVKGLSASGVASQTNIIDMVGCQTSTSGHVTVEYSMPQQLYFAEVLGFGKTSPVRARATAAWGVTGGANPVPIVLNFGTLQGQGCDVPHIPPGTTCYFWFDNGLFVGSNFGMLDLGNGWDVTGGAAWTQAELQSFNGCNEAGGAQQLADWISGAVLSHVQTNYPNPTYVCSDSGTPDQKVWGSLGALADSQAIRDFPINYIGWGSPTSGAPDQGQVTKAGSVSLYDIVGFAQLQFVALLDGTTAGGVPPTVCDQKMNLTKGQSYLFSSMGPGNGCPTTTPTTVTDLTVNGGTTGFTQNGNTGFTWNAADVKQAEVKYTWSLSGQCGVPPAGVGGGNAHCLILKWNGSTVGGDYPGAGADFGLRSVRLCDFTIKDSCPPGS